MCGVFGITGHPLGKKLLSIAMMALQHRGHDAAGVAGLVSHSPRWIETVKGTGKVVQVLTENRLEKFIGNTFIAHTRYATRNSAASTREIHPHWAQSLEGRLAIVTNGDLLNDTLEEQGNFLKEKGVRLYTHNDAEIIAALINYELRYHSLSVLESISKTMRKIRGGYGALVMMEEDSRLFAFRDPQGIRPLHIAEFEISGQRCVAFSSETCAFDIVSRFIAARFPDHKTTYTHCEVRPGEVIAVSEDGVVEKIQAIPAQAGKLGCVFEGVYFSRPDSLWEKRTFQVVREKMGEELHLEASVEADLVTAVPKGGIPSAVGYARASGIEYRIGILEEPITGGIRSFTTNEKERIALARIKYNILEDVIKGKRLVVVDDSIVRGTTMRLLVQRLFDAGAKEVHLRIPCPPYRNPCHYGIATKEPETLISYNRSTEEICAELGATSLAYLSINGLYRAIERPQKSFCDECLSGNCPF